MNPKAEALLAAGLGSRASLGWPGDKYEMGMEHAERIEVVAEALVSDLPVITSSLNGASEIIIPRKNGTVIADPRDTAAVVEAIGRDRLGLQFDVYHVQTTEGDITKRMEQYMPVIAHMQIADVPARNEPGTGEIGWSYVFRRMDELGYQGWVGCEYRPARGTQAHATSEGLGWFRGD